MTKRDDPTRYPLTFVGPCPYCGDLVTRVRQGDGRPWRGGLNYWYRYDPPHDCDEMKRLRAEHDRSPLR